MGAMQRGWDQNRVQLHLLLNVCLTPVFTCWEAASSAGTALHHGSLTPTVQPFVENSTYKSGSCEDMAESIGCSGNTSMSDAQREHCESACDLATHVLCHPCALCQEARELRRKLPHPGFTAKPVIVMLPPGGQTMGR